MPGDHSSASSSCLVASFLALSLAAAFELYPCLQEHLPKQASTPPAAPHQEGVTL